MLKQYKRYSHKLVQYKGKSEIVVRRVSLVVVSWLVDWLPHLLPAAIVEDL